MSFINEFVERIKSARNILIFTHVNPDGDTLGSAIALKLFIKEYFNKSSEIIHIGTLPGIYTYLHEYNSIKNISDIADNTKCDLAIAVDIASSDRLAEALALFQNADYRINIDHHKTNCSYGDLNLIDGDACSVGFILCKIFNKLDFKFSKEIAVALYTSIMADTGAFKYENTTPECLRIAAQLIESGANPCQISRACYETKPMNMLKFQLYVLGKAKFYLNGKLAMTSVSADDMKKFDASNDFTEGIVEVLRTAQSVEIAAILKETQEGYTKVSLRSKNVDLIPIISDFGGGGHTFSAGCTIKKPLSIAYDKLLEKIENALQ